VLGGELPEGPTLDLVAPQEELDVGLTALRKSLKGMPTTGYLGRT
jgi:GntR family galactonate operon transcriptional repressor